MLFLATFFPTWEGGAGVYDFVGVSFKLSATLSGYAFSKGTCLYIKTFAWEMQIKNLYTIIKFCICYVLTLTGVHEGHSGHG